MCPVRASSLSAGVLSGFASRRTLHAAQRAQSTVSVVGRNFVPEDQAASTSSLFHDDTASLRVSPPVSFSAWCRKLSFNERGRVREGKELRIEELRLGRGRGAKDEPAQDSPRITCTLYRKIGFPTTIISLCRCRSSFRRANHYGRIGGRNWHHVWRVACG